MKIVYDAMSVDAMWEVRAKFPLWLPKPASDALLLWELEYELKKSKRSIYLSIMSRFQVLCNVCHMPRRLKKLIPIIYHLSCLDRTEKIEDKVILLWKNWTKEWLYWYRRWKQRFDNSK